MTSRLSSLLVRDGLVPADRMERVFQLQVIRGGALDTILLELGLVEDHRLTQYLSLATGLSAAEVDPSEERVEALRTCCDSETASRFGVVPLALENEELKVAVSDAGAIERMDELARELDIKVQPLVVPEYKLRLLHAKVFNEGADERFQKLAKRVDSERPLTPPPEDKGNESALAAPREEIATETAETIPNEAPLETVTPADTSERIRGKRAPEEKPARRTQEMTTTSVQEAVAAKKDSALDGAEGESLPAETASLRTEIEESTAPAETPVPGAAEDGNTPIAVDTAREMLSQSTDRDEIFIIFLRALRRRAHYTSLFTVKGSMAAGRLALSKNGLDEVDIRKVKIPIDRVNRFEQVAASKAFSVGPLESKDSDSEEALTGLGGGQVPSSALLLPIVMRNRLIAIAVAHNGDRSLNVGSFTELLPLGVSTADALSRVLAQMRANKDKKNTPGPDEGGASGQGQAGMSKGASVQPAKENSGSDSVPHQNAETSANDSSVAVPVADPEMVALFERLESDDEDVAAKAVDEALAMLDRTIAHLEFAFPGTLNVARGDSEKRLKAAEHGPVLALITRIGPAVGPALSEKMRDADRELRYYATLCAVELRPPEVLNQLVERLFDGDESIRDLAVEALKGYPDSDRQVALEFARRALHSEDTARVRLASEGLTRLADTSAIGDLIDAHSRGGDAAEVSRKALFELTNQDFGNSNKKWRTWWEENQERHRVEWMLDGLNHKKANIRKQAADTLREVTGEFFGYAHDLPKKERDKKRKLWRDWWKSERPDR